PRPQLANAARALIEETPRIVEFLSGIFGPYPFRQLGGVVPDAPSLRFAWRTRRPYGEGFFGAGPGCDGGGARAGSPLVRGQRLGAPGAISGSTRLSPPTGHWHIREWPMNCC